MANLTEKRATTDTTLAGDVTSESTVPCFSAQLKIVIIQFQF
jgi:hypothetical protein